MSLRQCVHRPHATPRTSRDGDGGMPSWRIHPFASRTILSSSASIWAIQIVASYFILPPTFSTIMTPKSPERCFFLLTNIVKKNLCVTPNMATQRYNYLSINVIKNRYFSIEEVRVPQKETSLHSVGSPSRNSFIHEILEFKEVKSDFRMKFGNHDPK